MYCRTKPPRKNQKAACRCSALLSLNRITNPAAKAAACGLSSEVTTVEHHDHSDLKPPRKNQKAACRCSALLSLNRITNPAAKAAACGLSSEVTTVEHHDQ